MCYLLHTYHQMCPGLRISGLLWEDGQAPSDSCGGFLECSGKMVRPHQTAMEDFWSALGRWSGPIRQLWKISGLLQEDGQAPSDCCQWRISGMLWEDGQVQYCGFSECSEKMIRPHQTAMEDF